MFSKIFILASVLATSLVAEQAYTDQLQQFKQYKQSQQNQFQTYQQAQKKAFDDYKKELSVFWDEPKLSNKTEWITYSKDQKTRTDVDFENELITIETFAASKKQAQKKIDLALAKALTIDTKTAYMQDPLQKKLNTIPTPENITDDDIDTKPILKDVVFTNGANEKNLQEYVEKNTKNIQTFTTNKQETLYVVKVKLPKNTTYKRSEIYFEDVLKNSKKQDIPLPLIFAIIHSESSFNPMARSYVPAFGLMQIVPKTAGVDAYHYLYNEKRLVSGNYLYNSQNNIKLGSAYLHILYYRYLKYIKNPQSRLYCTIAAYNTGAGNVARAFVGSNDVSSAAIIINTLSPKQVYARLLKDLKYDEPKVYLKRVSERKKVYENIYQQN